MSFTYQVKVDLCKIEPKRHCCMAAEAYGFLLFCRNFSLSEIRFKTENEFLAYRFAQLIACVCGVYVDVHTYLKSKDHSRKIYIASIDDREQRQRVMSAFGHSAEDVNLRVNRSVLEDEECVAGFLRGMFLACGALSEPKREYHMEFAFPFHALSLDLEGLLKEISLPPKRMNRQGVQILYYKESEQIEDFLTFIGASAAALEIMNVKIYKDIRNKVNRQNNCITANMDRTIAAAEIQARAIRKLMGSDKWDEMDEQTRELARLRLNNPDMSLRELEENLSYSISRSGINHRLKRMVELSREV